MKNKFKNQLIEYIFIGICTIIFLCIFINRLTYEVITSDESFWVATGYRFIKGNTPFGDMLEPTAGTAYIMFPFLLIRSWFIEGADGLVLYMRVCYLILNCICSIIVYIYIKQTINKKYAFFLCQILIFFAPFQTYNFYYGSLAALFMQLAICLTLLTNYKNNCFYCFFSGISMAITVIVYPTMFICAFIMLLFIITTIHPTNKVRAILLYVLGGVSIALFILMHVVISYGFLDMLQNVKNILFYGRESSLTEGNISNRLIETILYWKYPFKAYGIKFTVVFVTMYLTALFNKTKIISRCLIPFYIIESVYLSSYIFRDENSLTMNFIFTIVLIGPLSLFLAIDKKVMIKKLLTEWCTSLMIFFVVALSSGGGYSNSRAELAFAAVVSIKLVLESINKNENVINSIEKYLIITLIISGEIFLFYRSTYKSDNCQFLTEKMNSGPYMGIKTTPERKEYLEELQCVLKEVEEKDETVMILYHCCYAYLMVDMLPKIPSTWGCIDYEYYGFDNQDIIIKYLSIQDNIPDVILIIDVSEEYDYEDEQLKKFSCYYPMLNDFIDNYYTYIGHYEKTNSVTVYKYKLKLS